MNHIEKLSRIPLSKERLLYRSNVILCYALGPHIRYYNNIHMNRIFEIL